MAGHNKWSKIRHRKAVVDKRRSKAWTMCTRAIISAARQHGPDPDFNFALRAALDEAKYHNVPRENIERAIKKGAGGGEGDHYEPVRYEGYGPGGVAVIVEAFTDNRTRTAANVRNIFADYTGKLGTTGSVAHQFELKGRVVVSGAEGDEDTIIEAALSAGADDVRRDDGADAPTWDVLTPPTTLNPIADTLAQAGLNIVERGLEMIPNVTVVIAGEQAQQLAELVDAMEDDEDVKKVYTNAQWPEE